MVHNEILFNSATSIVIIIIFLILGNKNIKIGLLTIICFSLFYITYLS